MAKPSTLPVEQTTAANFHQELTEWRRQDALWLDELSVLHKEHETGLADLARLEQSYHELAEAVAKARAELTTHEQALHAHERTLAQYLQGGEALGFAAIEQQHRTAGARHAERQRQIEQAKRLFQGVRARMEVVRRALVA